MVVGARLQRKREIVLQLLISLVSGGAKNGEGRMVRRRDRDEEAEGKRERGKRDVYYKRATAHSYSQNLFF